MPKRSIVFLGTCLALTGCAVQQENKDDDPNLTKEPKVQSGPQYTSETRITGVYRFQFELASIDFCPDAKYCHDPSEYRYGEGCWTGFNENAQEDLDRLDPNDVFYTGGSFWIEGTGRIAVQPGMFGHNGYYNCQVQFSSVSEFKKIHSLDN